MATNEQQLAAANAAFDALTNRVSTLEHTITRYSGLLDIMMKHESFFSTLPPTLEAEITSLRSRIDKQDRLIKDLDDQINEIPFVKQPVGHKDLRQAMETLRTELSPSQTTVVPKPRIALPDVFSGKREDWKSFQSRLDLFFVAHDTAYPSDTDKILFAISRLGTDTAASKSMERYIPNFRLPAEQRPALLCNLNDFFLHMSKSFGVTNSHLVAEIAIRNLKQKGSALDYTNKFTNLAADVKWNNSEDAMISAYRLGLKEAVLETIAREEEPATFAEFSQLAIDIDTRQYSYSLTKTSTRSYTAPPVRPAATTHAPRPAAPAYESTPSPMDLGQAQHRPIDLAEKKRRKDNNLCGYCAAEDHWIRDCPLKKDTGKPTLKAAQALPGTQTSTLLDVVVDLGKDNA
jgi:uncharacterized coiled-coil protein SlyX